MADTEREAFEKAMNDSRFFPRQLGFSRTKSPSGRDEYANSHLQSNWEGWQARAALASRPAEVDGSPVDQACARVRRAEAELKAARKALEDAMTTAARTDE